MSTRVVNKGRNSLCGWSEIWDEQKGKYYYHDPVTNQTSWKHPKEMGIFPVVQRETESTLGSDSPSTSGVSGGKYYIKHEKEYQRVKYGFVAKMGEINKSFKTRYFVLYTDGELEYYADVPKPKNPQLYCDVAFYKGELKGSVNVKGAKFCVSKVTIWYCSLYRLSKMEVQWRLSCWIAFWF